VKALLFQAYDSHLEQLTGVAERVCRVLREAGIDYRIVGGLAVWFHVQSRDPLAARLTKDVDLAVDRADLPRIAEAVRGLGLKHRHVAGIDMLVDAAAPQARSGVHLLFVREKVRPNDLEPVPGLSEPTVSDEGILLVAPSELVRMKLISFRQRDKTHIIDMDSVGLITPEIEAAFPDALRERLRQVRAEEAQSTGGE
jgi:hypothetical protein